MRAKQIAYRGVVLWLLSMLTWAAPASAAGTAEIADTTLYTYKWEYGSVPRTITGPTTSGWPVAFLKTDGPRMYMGAG